MNTFQQIKPLKGNNNTFLNKYSFWSVENFMINEGLLENCFLFYLKKNNGSHQALIKIFKPNFFPLNKQINFNKERK